MMTRIRSRHSGQNAGYLIVRDRGWLRKTIDGESIKLDFLRIGSFLTEVPKMSTLFDQSNEKKGLLVFFLLNFLDNYYFPTSTKGHADMCPKGTY
jgi:hypothetical protein